MFADPPYGGEGIQYAELSALWVRLAGAGRGWTSLPRSASTRCRGAAGRTTPPGSPTAFAAVREAIESGGVLTVTFASREAPAWRALADALEAARFRIEADERRPRRHRR